MAWEYVSDPARGVAGWIDRAAARGWAQAADRAAREAVPATPLGPAGAEAWRGRVSTALQGLAASLDLRPWLPLQQQGRTERYHRDRLDAQEAETLAARTRQLDEWLRAAKAAGQPTPGIEPTQVGEWMVRGWNPRTATVVDYASDPDAIRWGWFEGDEGPVVRVARPQRWGTLRAELDVERWRPLIAAALRDPSEARSLWRDWIAEENRARARYLGLADETALRAWSAMADLRNFDAQQAARMANVQAANQLAQALSATGVLAPAGALVGILAQLFRALPAASAVDEGPFGLGTFRSGGPLETTRPVHTPPPAPVPLAELVTTITVEHPGAPSKLPVGKAVGMVPSSVGQLLVGASPLVSAPAEQPVYGGPVQGISTGYVVVVGAVVAVLAALVLSASKR